MSDLAIFALQVQPSKVYTQTVTNAFRISSAALSSAPSSNERTSLKLMLNENKSEKYTVANFIPNGCEYVLLDLICLRGETVHFTVEGKGTVTIMGNYLPVEDSEDEDIDLDEEEEEAESEAGSEADLASMEAYDKFKEALRKGEIPEDEEDDEDYASDADKEDEVQATEPPAAAANSSSAPLKTPPKEKSEPRGNADGDGGASGELRGRKKKRKRGKKQN